MRAQAEQLLALGAQRYCLMKGGHGTGPEAVDLLVTPGRRTARLSAGGRVGTGEYARHRLHAVIRPSPPASQRAAPR
jgi:hypothetical protein